MGSTELKIEKLTEDNYFSWVVEAEAALSMKGMWSAVEEDDEFRELTTPEKKRKQRQAWGFLVLSISKDVRECVISEDTPKKMWEALHEKFSQKTE